MSLRDRLAFLSQGTEGMAKEEVVSEWQTSVSALLSRVYAALHPLVEANLLSVTETRVAVNEPTLSYTSPALELKSGPKSIVIAPVGRLIPGYTGRVDLASPDGTIHARLLRKGIRKDEKWFTTGVRQRNALADLGAVLGGVPKEEIVPFDEVRLEMLLDLLFSA